MVLLLSNNRLPIFQKIVENEFRFIFLKVLQTHKNKEGKVQSHMHLLGIVTLLLSKTVKLIKNVLPLYSLFNYFPLHDKTTTLERSFCVAVIIPFHFNFRGLCAPDFMKKMSLLKIWYK